MTCRDCGTKKRATIKYLMGGGLVCRTCNPTSSAKEYEVVCYLRDELGINVEVSKNIKDPNQSFYRELDMYLPEYRIGIEFDGLYWHSEEKAGRKKQITFTPFLLLGYGLTEVFM
jgi:hypothetical protein